MKPGNLRIKTCGAKSGGKTRDEDSERHVSALRIFEERSFFAGTAQEERLDTTETIGLPRRGRKGI